MQVIYVKEIEDMVAIVAGLTKEGLCFKVERCPSDDWKIEINGY